MPNEYVKERRVHAYLKPCNDVFFKKYIAEMEIGKSRGINEAVKALKACLPPEDLKKIMSRNNY